MSARPITAVSLFLVLVVTGCGSGAHAKEAPAQIWADAVTALRSSPGYVMQGSVSAGGATERLVAAVHDAHSLEVTLAGGADRVAVIVVPRGTYLRANAVYWRAQAGAQGVALAGRWVRVSRVRARQTGIALGRFAPSTVGRCLEEHGTLTIAGRTRIEGIAAIVINDAGNVPGDAPGSIAVAERGRPYPLRIAITGPTRPGGPVNGCNNGQGGDTRESLTFSRFGQVPAFKAPAGAIEANFPALGA